MTFLLQLSSSVSPSTEKLLENILLVNLELVFNVEERSMMCFNKEVFELGRFISNLIRDYNWRSEEI